MGERVTLVEVGPRDGLQIEPNLVSTADKILLVNELSACGFSRIEVTSFVSPKWVPQMADAAEVMAGITRRAGTSYAVLTPNMKGFQSALAADADEVAVFTAASEGFSQHNTNCSVAESLARIEPVAEAAWEVGIPMRGYISCVVACPYDGPTPPAKVVEVVKALIALGCYEVSLGDTIGAATPATVGTLLDALLPEVPAGRLAGHFHDTKGRALDNIKACLARGLRVFDCAVGGLGGCPYAPGAPGNVATETVVARLHDLGFETGVDTTRLAQAARFAASLRSTR